MALKLTLPMDSEILQTSPVQETDFYIKITGLHFLPEKSKCVTILSYRAIDPDNQPVGEPLTVPGLPAVLAVWEPRVLMMSKEQSAYELAYGSVYQELSTKLGPAAVIEALL
ncbi:hypothetical protein MUN81_10400 [Hymenobacter sp. 5317J-9]|uniref:hypothetical protein n=1 Tax=Hymenobacter sp. 5317J-9 TaxID=2932250 RepID=UPI001FD722FA|nr:hypothetical protein [Hymenobacter sp. 5317J-9]UOQ99889.1 hypothetical protein MUN81_10400 [Hymenobacter sp. 5317J-9]